MMNLKTRGSVLCALLMAVVLSACDPDADPSKDPGNQQPRPGRVTGVVLTEEGAPLKDFDVTLLETGKTVTTDAQGKFTFESLPPATYGLSASGPGYDGAIQEVEVEAGMTVAMSFNLKATVIRVSGRVQQQDGTPVGGAYLSILDQETKEVLKRVTANAQGEFTVDLAPGLYTLEAERDGFETYSDYLIVIQDPDPVIITLQSV
ncbi:carboxypeptidase regulatory-like domain-containing protein [Corallococcus macrosporus]|uniref:Carboxypeptidase regulatory-like domain-containing protein n=1 Tax=Corallococcus macrosporus TaxID=35 RepID=A0ABS3D5J1_9BACT|nr:carboxypeptidase-like regulatory domain-containing protein [Corallococcus macrosporus]MBN8226938.1 carboxypeptidase regulatory-like domain-containing protein [Corallococcus macrosporus]